MKTNNNSLFRLLFFFLFLFPLSLVALWGGADSAWSQENDAPSSLTRTLFKSSVKVLLRPVQYASESCLKFPMAYGLGQVGYIAGVACVGGVAAPAMASAVGAIVGY